jgi:hypothetical protein
MNSRFKAVTYLASSLALALTVSSPAFSQGMKMATPMAAQAEPKPTIKTLAENEKVRAIDEVRRPGEMSPMGTRPMRVLYVFKGGILERTFADGSKETQTLKSGQTVILTETRPYSVTNIGKTAIHIFEVIMK